MTGTATEQQVRLAAQLYQARDSVRRLLGDKYAVRMAELGASLQRLAAARNSSVLKEATHGHAVHAWFAGRCMLNLEPIAWMPFAVPDHPCALPAPRAA